MILLVTDSLKILALEKKYIFLQSKLKYVETEI